MDHVGLLRTAVRSLQAAYEAGAGKLGNPFTAEHGGSLYSYIPDELQYPLERVKDHLTNKYMLHKMLNVPQDAIGPQDPRKIICDRAMAEAVVDDAFGAILNGELHESIAQPIKDLTTIVRALEPADTVGETVNMIEDITSFVEKELTTKARKAIPTDEFADPEDRAYPIHDKAHADNAAARLEQQKSSMSAEKYAAIKARIKKAQAKFGESDPPTLPLHLLEETPQPLPRSLHPMVEALTVLSEAAGNTSETPKYKMLVIREGMSKNRVKYPGSVLRESVRLLNGRSIYVDHPEGARTGQAKERSLATKAGWWSNAKYEESIPTADGSSTGGITATANLFSPSNSPVSWLPGMIQESIDRGNPEAVGISILAGGQVKFSRDAGGVYKEAVSIEMYTSADAVAEPGAGGHPLAFVASKGVDLEVDALETLTLEQLRESRPDLYATIVETVRAASPEPAPAPAPAPTPAAPVAPVADPAVTALVESLQTQQTQMTEMLNTMHINTTSALLESILVETNLPPTVRTRIRNRVSGSIMAESAIRELVGEYVETARAVVTDPDSPTSLPPGAIIPFGQAVASGHLAEGQVAPLDQVMLSLDDYFGAPVDPKFKGKFPKIRSFAEAYRQITGDYEVDGRINKQRSVLGDLWFREAIPGRDFQFVEALPGAASVIGGGTITMTGLLGTSMNKALFNFYQEQPRWWESVVTKTDLNNMKVQDRIRLANFGSLTNRTVDGAEYTELAWGETKEQYSPTEYGNVVPVGRIAIINDDLKGIQSIPRLLAQSAVTTINEYVANLFTQGSGLGPTLTDTFRVFDASNHQNNLMHATLTRANLIAARQRIMKMKNDASKVIGLMGRHLLVPIDLEDTAYELINTANVPDSANNAKNILADTNQGVRNVIVVPQLTDVDNWYLMADPGQITGIEMGFLFGREEPELFQQDNPTVGMVFTNDVMNHKIRWDFGGDWLDYRAAVASVNP